MNGIRTCLPCRAVGRSFRSPHAMPAGRQAILSILFILSENDLGGTVSGYEARTLLTSSWTLSTISFSTEGANGPGRVVYRMASPPSYPPSLSTRSEGM